EKKIVAISGGPIRVIRHKKSSTAPGRKQRPRCSTLLGPEFFGCATWWATHEILRRKRRPARSRDGTEGADALRPLILGLTGGRLVDDFGGACERAQEGPHAEESVYRHLAIPDRPDRRLSGARRLPLCAGRAVPGAGRRQHRAGGAQLEGRSGAAQRAAPVPVH